MAKPRTTYILATKPTTSFTKLAKNVTTYRLSQTDGGSWLLNSTIVTLNSLVYLLSGYTGATPNQSNNKNATTFTVV